MAPARRAGGSRRHRAGGYYQGYPASRFGPPSFGGGVPQYGPTPPMPAPRRRNPLRFIAFSHDHCCALAALAGLVITGLSSGPSEAAYQNDDYQVPPPDRNPPPIPLPQTYEEADQLITKNSFYRETVPTPVRCNSEPINVTTASDAQLKSHFEGLMECLVRVREPPVVNSGWIIVRPTVTIYGERAHHEMRHERHQCLLLLSRSAGLLQQPAATGSCRLYGATNGPLTSSWLMNLDTRYRRELPS